MSSLATIAPAATVTVTVAVSQLDGLSRSHKVYVIVYVPAGVFGATVTVPSALTVSGPVVIGARVALPPAPSTIGLPLRRSLAVTLMPVLPPDEPLTGPAVSSLATIAPAVTVTVTVAVSQFDGLRRSHRV